MKKTFIYLIAVLLFPIVYGISGGENFTLLSANNCNILNISITVTPYQSVGEYTITPLCTEVSFINNTRKFYCNCESNYTNVWIYPKLGSVGNYSFVVEIFGNSTIPTHTVTNIYTINQTFNVTFPNNVTVTKIIYPNQSLQYTTFPTYIVPDSNVTITNITVGSYIQFVATSHGYKCFDVYTTRSSPSNVYIDGINNPFTFNNNIIHFCTTFTTRRILINWVTPSIGSSTGGGSTGGRLIGYDPCVNEWECEDWMPCVDGWQTRTCKVPLGCTVTMEPEQARSCSNGDVGEENYSIGKSKEKTVNGSMDKGIAYIPTYEENITKNNNEFLPYIIFTVIVLVGVGIGMIISYKRNS